MVTVDVPPTSATGGSMEISEKCPMLEGMFQVSGVVPLFVIVNVFCTGLPAFEVWKRRREEERENAIVSFLPDKGIIVSPTLLIRTSVALFAPIDFGANRTGSESASPDAIEAGSVLLKLKFDSASLSIR